MQKYFTLILELFGKSMKYVHKKNKDQMNEGKGQVQSGYNNLEDNICAGK